MSVLAMMRIKHLTHTPDGRKLTPSEKGVLMQIADDHNEDRGYAWPSIPTLAVRVGLSEKQCRRVIRKLEEEKVLQSRPRLRDDNYGRLANDYRFWFDKPFDAASTAKTDKRLRLQASQTAARPKQMKLNAPPAPPPAHGRGSLPPMGGTDGHAGEGDPPADGRGGLPPMGGLATPVQPEISLKPTTPQLPGLTPLPPDSGGENGTRWTAFKMRLKLELSEQPLQHSNFRPVVRGESDYDACFRDWWLTSIERREESWVFRTEAAKPRWTIEGQSKYAQRLDRLAREIFAPPAETRIRFFVEGPKPSGT